MNAWKALITAALAGLSLYLQELAVPVAVMCGAMLLDYFTGVGKAWMIGEVSSQVGIKGIVKKVGYIALVGVGMIVDFLIQNGLAQVGHDATGRFAVALLIIVWLILNECISITENLAMMGVGVPEWLRKMLKIAQETEEMKNTDKEDEK